MNSKFYILYLLVFIETNMEFLKQWPSNEDYFQISTDEKNFKFESVFEQLPVKIQ